MNARVISFHYVLKNKSGETLDSSREGEPMSFVEGKRQIITGLEDNIKDLKEGEKKQVTVEAQKAYGIYDSNLVMSIPRTQFPPEEKIEAGDQFRVSMPGNEAKIFTVTGVTETHVNVDGNHPLAGEDLTFDLEITGIRTATEADLKDEGCCDHDHHDHEHHHH